MTGTTRDDPRITEADSIPIGDVADRLGIAGLKRSGQELVGPCPVCAGGDRFSINPRLGVFNCRHCGGGRGLKLVMHVLGCTFPEALDWLVGARDIRLDPAEARRRRHQAADQARDREAEAEKFRRAAIDAAREIWKAGRRAPDPVLRGYLACRGITSAMLGDLPTCLRLHPDLAYTVPDGATGWRTVHRGPAMLAAIQGPDDRFGAVHRTWVDLTSPKGKAAIRDGDTVLQAKKVLGHKKGGAIRLWTPPGASLLIMGEGIETTLTARVAGPPAAAYWAGVDLGNMSGRRQTGPGLKFAGLPDMADREAFVPPPWVRRLVFIQDGDSDARDTRAKLLAGLRRAMVLRPGLTAAIVHAGDGRDLNDLLMRSEEVADV